ncbi:MAG: DUF3105 domain-containing protein [Deltaproteobacteria bacterium]|nr:DUF3105 domain-containing protein [Deltaproteobacteria bacterium]
MNRLSCSVRVALLAAIAAIAAAAPGCGTSEDAGPRDAAVDPPFTPVTDAGACGVTTAHLPPASAKHLEQGTPLTFASNPPCGGDHWSFWTTWGAHATAVPRGNWIHNLEHGGVAFLYRCASRAACPDLAAKVEAVALSLPQEARCAPPIRNRIVVTADPDLPEGVEVAAASWGYNLVARCLDEAALRDFYRARVGRAPEDTCAEGVEVSAPVDSGTDGESESGVGDAAIGG